jgi:hypothetical protein
MMRIALVAVALGLAGCGYHVTGHGDLIPKSVKTIAIPAFANVTPRQNLARLLTTDVTREFISRTRYQVVEDPHAADAVLQCTLTNFELNPIIFDPATYRATTVHVRATLRVTLTDRVTGKVIFSQPRMQWDERYQVSLSPQDYFDESSTAIVRIGHAMAQALVSAVLENF